jgi:ABC-type nitrate/sulfonate/bicarbonate transport system ATPase subunit
MDGDTSHEPPQGMGQPQPSADFAVAAAVTGPSPAPDEDRRPTRVALHDIAKTFVDGNDGEEVVAVDGVSFDVRNAEFVTIVGPSGCGKSTILNVIAGLEEPTAGRIVIDGAELADRRAHFGYMFQKDLLFPWRTIRNNVAVGLEVLGTPKKEARAQAQAILDRFDLGRFANKYPIQLSGGMRQRVALMRTLICEREILLLDEPFGALDALTRSIMQEWLLGIWEADHRTIIFITHDIEEAVFLSDRVLMMSARPGIIKGEIEIDLGRPRDHHIVTSPRFTELKKAILDQIYEESLKADHPD